MHVSLICARHISFRQEYSNPHPSRLRYLSLVLLFFTITWQMGSVSAPRWLRGNVQPDVRIMRSITAPTSYYWYSGSELSALPQKFNFGAELSRRSFLWSTDLGWAGRALGGRNLDLFQSYNLGGVCMGPTMAGGEESEKWRAGCGDRGRNCTRWGTRIGKESEVEKRSR